MGESVGYVDIYLLPVPEAAIEAYRQQAGQFGRVVVEHGALSYREFRADDLGDAFAARATDGEVLTAAVAEFESREHRDAVMDAVMADPSVKKLMNGEELADMSRMNFGGFETLVDA